MHVGMMLRQLLNQMLFVTRPWQRIVIGVAVAACGAAMIPAGLVLGQYGMTLAGVLILSGIGRISVGMWRARRDGRAAVREGKGECPAGGGGRAGDLAGGEQAGRMAADAIVHSRAGGLPLGGLSRRARR